MNNKELKIKLTQGQYTLVDADVFDKVNQFRWYAERRKKGFRAKGTIKLDGNKKSQPLSRYIYELKHGKIPEGMLIDHINHDTLDNRIKNLRLATRSENNRNRVKNNNNRTGFKGVSFSKKGKKFEAKIKINKKSVHLGYFVDAKDAYKAYCEASIKYHGEFSSIK